MLETFATLARAAGVEPPAIPEQRSVGIPAEWQQYVLGRMAGGIGVSPITALQCSALVACIRILSTTLSTTDLGVFKRLENGGLEPAIGHSVHSLLSVAPNARETSVEWLRNMIIRMLLYGRSYDQILTNAKDEVIGLVPLHPSRVKVDDEGDDPVFRMRDKQDKERVFKASDILYVPYLFEGESLFEHARRSIGLALSADEFAQKFFDSGGVQQLKLESDQTVGPDKKREIMESLSKALKAGMVPFMDSGTKLESLNVKFEEVQLKDTRIFQLRDIARIMGVQPHLIGDLERSTNNNIEHQGIEFVNFTLRPLAKAILARLNMSLFGPVERSRYCAKFDLIDLQQADFESTADAAKGLVTAGIWTANDARARIGSNPHPDGNRLLIQGAMVPISQAGQNTSQEVPANGAA